MIGSYGSHVSPPVANRELERRSSDFAFQASNDSFSQGLDRDAWSVSSEDRAAWDAALDTDFSASAASASPESTTADAVVCDSSLETITLPPATVLAPSASEFSQAGGSHDGDDPRHSPSTRFELLLGDSSSLQVDWSRQLTHWSLCLRTADPQIFAMLSRSTHDLSAALQSGFGSEVAVRVDRE